MKKRYTCSDYREEMILLGLKRRLDDPALSEEERRKIRQEIEAVEKRMGM